MSDQEGSFLTGFTVGLFAGAAGYYLFATKKGAKLRTQLSQEWQQAQEWWQQQDHKTTSPVQVWVEEFKEWIDWEDTKPAKSAQTSRKSESKTPPQKFKGS